MQQIFGAFFALFVSSQDAESLMTTAKDTYLTATTAATHITAARFAARFTDTDPDLLLAIAHHESRYTPTAVGPWVRGKRACGVMQHVPSTRTCPPPSPLHDYLDGARHLAIWIRAMNHNVESALVGYAGGYSLLRRCARGEKLRACAIGRIHLARADRIKRARRAFASPH